MKIKSSSPGDGTCAVFSKLGFCTFSVDVSGFCSVLFEVCETSGEGARGIEVLPKAYHSLWLIALIADEGWFLGETYQWLRFVENVGYYLEKTGKSFPLRVNWTYVKIVIDLQVTQILNCFERKRLFVHIERLLEDEELERGASVLTLESLARLLENLKILDRLNSRIIKKYRVGGVEKPWSSHVRIDLGGSLSNQSRASPSREKGKSKSLTEVFGTSGCLNVASLKIAFQGSENYNSWKRSMMIALNAKNKLKIVTGALNELNQISNNLNFVNSAYALWSELHEHYAQLDGLWDGHDALEAPYLCNCENGRNNGNREQRKRMIRQEEKQREGTMPKPLGSTALSEGHTGDECYKLKGYPVGHPLHGKYKPPVVKNSGVNDNRNPKVNLVSGQDVASTSTQAETTISEGTTHWVSTGGLLMATSVKDSISFALIQPQHHHILFFVPAAQTTPYYGIQDWDILQP
ncbi:cysteine-rich receptor-like protein kinase 8 [Tanacetum coccineum]